MEFNVQKKSFWYTNFQKSPYSGPTPFPRSVASLPRFGPVAMLVIILFMFALYISRYPIV